MSQARKKWLESQYPREVFECIRYLDLDKEGPNRGTKNKQELMVRTLGYLFEWKEGKYNDWIKRLANRLSVSTRTAKDNYLDPLISEGIVSRVSHKVFWVGITEPDSLEGP